ncbi:hypothetical protein G7Y89_g4348 [Cudoniella acicularis]|uniref:Uncharacterized protein n=1 Tax=Cudoniella acicularis TaxID=354080 RepID=A0A8H4RPL7_9HELO|nr:hypothetical protein G7Y89_g4348 [Cudoniella acicularis]
MFGQEIWTAAMFEELPKLDCSGLDTITNGPSHCLLGRHHAPPPHLDGASILPRFYLYNGSATGAIPNSNGYTGLACRLAQHEDLITIGPEDTAKKSVSGTFKQLFVHFLAHLQHAKRFYAVLATFPDVDNENCMAKIRWVAINAENMGVIFLGSLDDKYKRGEQGSAASWNTVFLPRLLDGYPRIPQSIGKHVSQTQRTADAVFEKSNWEVLRKGIPSNYAAMLHKYNVDSALELRAKQQCRFAFYNKFAPTIVLNSSSQMMELPDLEIRSWTWTWTWTQGRQRAKQALMESMGSTVIGVLKEEIRASIHFKIDQEEFSQSQFQLFVYKQLFLLWPCLYRGEIGHLEWMLWGLLPKWSYENTSTIPMLLETVQRRLRELRERSIEEVVINAPNFCYDSFTKSLKRLAESQPRYMYLNFGSGSSKISFNMIPAEIFPTRYRSTYYRLAFAAGTVGTIVGEVILTHEPLHTRGYSIIAFSAPPVLAALFAWGWLPEVQHRRNTRDTSGDRSPFTLEKETLERLGKDMKKSRESEHELGASFRMSINALRRRGI